MLKNYFLLPHHQSSSTKDLSIVYVCYAGLFTLLINERQLKVHISCLSWYI